MAIPVKQNLVASSKHSIKCPYPMEPEYITVHNTFNDATSENEVKYMIGNNNEVSFHFAIDDKQVVQGLRLDRNGWHCGDGSKGTGNRKSIGIEICFSKSGGTKYYQAEGLAIQFIAQLLKEKGWGIDRVKKHQDWSGKYCPHRILSEGRWNTFIAAISKELASLKVEAKTQKEEDDMLEKAIVINAFPDFSNAEILAARLKAPIYTRAALPAGKVAKELYVVGGSTQGMQADKIIPLTGKDRFEVATAVSNFLKK